MPLAGRVGPYRFFFFSNESREPPHVHVRRGECAAKFWLDPVHRVSSVGFALHEITRIERIVRAHREGFLEAWHDHFDA